MRLFRIALRRLRRRRRRSEQGKKDQSKKDRDVVILIHSYCALINDHRPNSIPHVDFSNLQLSSVSLKRKQSVLILDPSETQGWAALLMSTHTPVEHRTPFIGTAQLHRREEHLLAPALGTCLLRDGLVCPVLGCQLLHG